VKRIVILVVVVFALGAVFAYAANTTQGASPKKSGWQAVYDDMADWGWKKSDTSGKTKPKEKAPAPKKEETKKSTGSSVK